jgi:phenylalanyl-tRNA synthetase beta chain
VSTPVATILVENGRAVELKLGGQRFGFLGPVSAAGLKKFDLRGATVVAEIDLGVLQGAADLIPHYRPLSPYPAMSRDLNLIVDESVTWSALAATAQSAAGETLESLQYLETYRDPKKDGAGKKRLIFSLYFRAPDRTLTSDEADRCRDAVIAACGEKHQATLLR